MNLLNFYINTSKKEAIIIDNKITGIVLFEDIRINFDGVNTYELMCDCFDYTIHTFKWFLQETINKKLKVHISLKSKTKGSLVGYQWNQYLKKQKRKDLIYDLQRKGVQWVGYKYVLFESSDGNSPTTWLYNDEHGNIIFELTPVYPWFHSKPQPGETFIKYSQWMKTYKPLLTRTISKETAQQWIKQINDLIKVVKKNDRRLRCTGLDCVHCVKEGKTGCFCGS